ncbi:MAG TPA: glycosyltransferase family 39 protein [Ignavibacteria bacterium]
MRKDRLLIYLVYILIFSISIFLLIYTVYRAATLSFTFDESLSYNIFVPLKFMDIVSFKIALANNHIINTLCMKYISIIFGSSELLLRLPSILSHLVYIVFTLKILKNVASPLILLAGFLLLNINPYLLEFFSLARGYAMAISFTVVSIYFLLNYIGNNRHKSIIWSFIFAVLAVLSSFTLLIYFISLVAVVNIYWIVSQSHSNFNEILKKNILVIICSLILILILFEPIRKLIKFHELYDGGTTGFWFDTIGSLISASLYGRSYNYNVFNFIRYVIAVCSLGMIGFFLYQLLILKRKVFTEKFSIITILLFISCTVPVVQHLFLKSYFPINRMALFFVPLFITSFILTVSFSAKNRIMKLLVLPILLIFAGASVCHTSHSLNTSHTLYWKYDADTKKMLSDLELTVGKENKSPVKLGVMWLYEPTINFYRNTRKYDWLEMVTEETYKKPDYDYYYLADSCLDYVRKLNKPNIIHYLISDSYLVK